MGDTTAIVSAVKETLLPPDPSHYRVEHYALWDLDWLEINAVNSTLFIFIIATAAKVFATLSGQIHSFHFQLLLPPFLCWTGKYAGARNLGLSKSFVGQSRRPDQYLQCWFHRL